jgi:hypothetical protein
MIRLYRVALALALLLPIAVMACSAENTSPTGGTTGSTPANTPPDFLGRIQPLFVGNCTFSGCHEGVAPAHSLLLTEGQVYGNTVNVPAIQAPLLRIHPGLPDSSYLVHKIQGTHASVGGHGLRMPAMLDPLPQRDIDMIREWIAAGAEQ